MKRLITILASSLLFLTCATAPSNNLSVPRPAITWHDEGNYLKISKADAVKLMQYINLLEVNNGNN